jgi:UDP-N-acetylmuramoylalanine--D-glutamate ligase
MKIGIVGWGVEGQSAYHYFGPDNSYLIVNEEPRDDFPAESEMVKLQFIKQARKPGLTGNVKDLSYLEGIEQCDTIIYSVTNAKNLEKAFGNDASFWAKAKTIQHIFFEEVKTKNIIGVTGTKGKGTTSTLIYEMLKASGHTTFLGGNIGKPVLEFVKAVQADDWVVLELSSFQLYKFPYSPKIAVCLMIAPEHLDWHPDMTDYIEAKANLFSHQTADEIAIYFAKNNYSKELAERSPGHKIPYFIPPGAYVRSDGVIVIGEVEIIGKTEVKLLGEHNLQNICAAVTATWQVSQNSEALRSVLTTFSGLEHRLEFVREIDSIKFYNDSFASTPDAGTAAIEAIPGMKVMIMGGFDRNLPLDNFARAITKNSKQLRKVILIGVSAKRSAAALTQAGFNNFEISTEKNLATIVSQAKTLAQPNDSVVLSPGFASFDMFKNFEDRGNQYKRAVQAL